MKKLLVALLALVAVGGFVFAEDAAPVAAINGYVYASATVYDNAGNQGLGPNWLNSGNYTNLTLNYNAKVFGFTANWEFENDAVNTAWRDYTAWVKPFGDIAKVSVGKLRNGDYRLTSYVDGSGFNTRLANAEYGYMVQVYPISGLSLGVYNNIPAAGGAFDSKMIDVGASYMIPDMAKVVFAYKQDIDELFVGADLKMVKGLTAKLGFVMDTTTNADFNRIWATAGYGLMDSKLDLGLDTYYKMEGSAKTNTLWAKVNAAYDLGNNITPSFYVDLKNKDVNGVATMTEDFGGQLKFAAGDGALYTGVDVSLASGATTWSIPLAAEISF